MAPRASPLAAEMPMERRLLKEAGQPPTPKRGWGSVVARKQRPSARASNASGTSGSALSPRPKPVAKSLSQASISGGMAQSMSVDASDGYDVSGSPDSLSDPWADVRGWPTPLPFAARVVAGKESGKHADQRAGTQFIEFMPSKRPEDIVADRREHGGEKAAALVHNRPPPLEPARAASEASSRRSGGAPAGLGLDPSAQLNAAGGRALPAGVTSTFAGERARRAPLERRLNDPAARPRRPPSDECYARRASSGQHAAAALYSHPSSPDSSRERRSPPALRVRPQVAELLGQGSQLHAKVRAASVAQVPDLQPALFAEAAGLSSTDVDRWGGRRQHFVLHNSFQPPAWKASSSGSSDLAVPPAAAEGGSDGVLSRKTRPHSHEHRSAQMSLLLGGSLESTLQALELAQGGASDADGGRATGGGGGHGGGEDTKLLFDARSLRGNLQLYDGSAGMSSTSVNAIRHSKSFLDDAHRAQPGILADEAKLVLYGGAPAITGLAARNNREDLVCTPAPPLPAPAFSPTRWPPAGACVLGPMHTARALRFDVCSPRPRPRALLGTHRGTWRGSPSCSASCPRSPPSSMARPAPLRSNSSGSSRR